MISSVGDADGVEGVDDHHHNDGSNETILEE